MLSDKKTEELRKTFKDNVEYIKRRHDWLEASKRHKYIMEYDRLMGELNTILNKDPNAKSIDYLLNGRMANLKRLADESVNGIKHEIYAKGTDNVGVTGEHVAVGSGGATGSPTVPAAPTAPTASAVPTAPTAPVQTQQQN